MQTLYSSVSASIEIDETDKILCLRWKAHVRPDKLWGLMSTFMRLTNSFKIEKWLIDASDSDQLEFNENKIRELESALKNTQVRKIARLMSKNIFEEARINTILKKIPGPISFQFFSSEVIALQWLRD